jgi:hypothetical protein
LKIRQVTLNNNQQSLSTEISRLCSWIRQALLQEQLTAARISTKHRVAKV